DDVVLALAARRSGLAVVDEGAGQVLQLERDVLRDVAPPRAVLEARDEAAAAVQRAGVVRQGRDPLEQPIDEARDLVRRVVLEDAQLDEQLHDRGTRPVVRAAQDAGLEDLQRRQWTAGARARAVPLGARGLAGRLRGDRLRRDRLRRGRLRCLAVGRLRLCGLRLRGRLLRLGRRRLRL